MAPVPAVHTVAAVAYAPCPPHDGPDRAPFADDPGLSIALRAFPPPEAQQPTPSGPTFLCLTPEQRHYLISALVSLQLGRELDDLMRPGQLALYGPPFAPSAVYSVASPTSTLSDGQRDPGPEPVIFRHIFHSTLKVFPFLDTLPARFWRLRIQALADDLAVRQMSSPYERGMMTLLRYRLLMVVDLGSHYFSRGVGIADEVQTDPPEHPSPSPWKAQTKRGLARPARLPPSLLSRIDNLFPLGSGAEGEAWKLAGEYARQQAWDWRAFWVQCIEEPGGIRKAWTSLATPMLDDLPPDKRNVVRVVRNGLADLLHQLLMVEPERDLMFRSLKNGVANFPFWAVRQVLRSSSATGIVQGLVSLLLARPAGTQSVIQRIVRNNFAREHKLFEATRVRPVAESIPARYEPYAKIVNDYVDQATPARREAVAMAAKKEGDDILTAVLLLGLKDRPVKGGHPVHVQRMQASFARSQYVGHLDAASPTASAQVKSEAARDYQAAKTVGGHDVPPLTPADGQDALAFARLKLLLRETFYARDLLNAKGAMKSGLVPGLIKDLLDALMPVCVLASKQAHLADRLLDVQNFLLDLVATRERGDSAPEAWSALIARHEQNLWTLLHELSCIPEVAESLLAWCERGCAFMATSEVESVPNAPNASTPELALGEKHRGSKVQVDCAALLNALDPSVQAKVIEELDGLVNWSIWDHVRSELTVRRGFILAHLDTHPPAGLGRAHTPASMAARVANVDGMVSRLMAESESDPDIASTRPDSGHCASPARGTEARTDPRHWFDSLDPCGQHLLSEGPDRVQVRYSPIDTAAPPPSLLYTRTLLPAFLCSLKECLPRYI